MAGRLTSPAPWGGEAGVGKWGQLTFTSVDLDEDGRLGGWQVKDEDPTLTSEEKRLLGEHLDSTLDTVDEIPRFVRPEDLATLPRRLMVSPSAGALAFWHAAPAGVDATGRPGNVFVHALVDRRDPMSTHPDRPIEMWRSPAWLTPFGQADVRAATLPDERSIVPGDAADRRAALDHIFDPDRPYRPGVLSVLADAVHWAAETKGTVVLGVPNPDDAALWISALGQMCAPATIRSVTWSTYERVRDGRDLATLAHLTLACVPQRDLVAVPAGSPVVVIDSDEDFLPVQWGDVPTLTRHGNEVAVTAWGSLIAGATFSRDNADAVLKECDRLLARLLTHAGLTFALPLALVELTTDLIPGASEAARDALEHAPAGVLGQMPEVLERIGVLVDEELGESAADAWEVVRRHADRRVAPELRSRSLRAYLERAVQDVPWLLTQSRHTRPAEDREAAELIDAEPLVDLLVDASASDQLPASVGREIALLDGVDLLLASGLTLQEDLVRHLLTPVVEHVRAQGPQPGTEPGIETTAVPLLDRITVALPATRSALAATLESDLRERPAAAFPWLPRGLARAFRDLRRSDVADPFYQDDVLWGVAQEQGEFDRTAVIDVIAALPAETRVAPWVLGRLRSQQAWTCSEAATLRGSRVFLEAAQAALWRDSTSQEAKVLGGHYLEEIGYDKDWSRHRVGYIPPLTRLALCAVLRPVRVYEDDRITGTVAGNYLSCLTGLLREAESPELAGHRPDALRAVVLHIVYGDCSSIHKLTTASRNWATDLADDAQVVSEVAGLGPQGEPSERAVKDGALLSFRTSHFASPRELDRVRDKQYWLNGLRTPISGATPLDIVTLRELEALPRPEQVRLRRVITAELEGAMADPVRKEDVAQWWRATYGSLGEEGIGQRIAGRLPFGRRRTEHTEGTPQ